MKKLICLVALLLMLAPSANAQKCSTQTVLGTYAFQISGSVLAGAPPTLSNPLTTNAVHRDLGMVGIVTFRPDGIVSGFYWAANGAQTTTNRLPFQATYTVTEDCTGYYEYPSPLAVGKVRENFMIFNQGDELRIMLASDATAIGASMPFALMNYGGVAYRITRQAQPYCSRDQILASRYAITCAGSMLQHVEAVGGVMVLSTNSQIDLHLAWDGSVAGNHLVKVGPTTEDFITTGAIQVNEDCTAQTDLIYTAPQFSGTVKVQTAFFDHGNRGFALPLFTVVGDTSIPFQGWACTWTKMPTGPRSGSE